MIDEAVKIGIENAYFNAARQAHEAAIAQLNAEDLRGRPFVIYGARVFMDGDSWCALLGENIGEGVCGFGKSPNEAVKAFDKAWYAELALEAERKG